MYASVEAGQQADKPLRQVYKETYETLKPDFGEWVIFDHCLPFDVSRAYDEAQGIADPRIWSGNTKTRFGGFALRGDSEEQAAAPVERAAEPRKSRRVISRRIVPRLSSRSMAAGLLQFAAP